MPIQDTFRNSRDILDVKEVAKKYHKQYKTLIVTFQRKVLTILQEKNVVAQLLDIEFGTAQSKVAIYELVDYPDILFYLSPIGAPTTVGILEEIMFAFDIQNIVMFGSCGVLDREISAGKIIVPSKAYRDEGTSYHYQPASDFIDITNSEKVSNVLSEKQVPFVKGYTWTTDAFYRETEAIYNERKAQGCISVEMEVSAVQAFCNLRGYSLYTFIYGADNLDANMWDKRILGNLSLDKRYVYFEIALAIATRI